MIDDVNLAAFRLGTRTPCCDRVGSALPGHRVLCRGCGSVFRNVAADVQAAFPGCLDVTPMTPRRYLRRDLTITDAEMVAVDG